MDILKMGECQYYRVLLLQLVCSLYCYLIQSYMLSHCVPILNVIRSIYRRITSLLFIVPYFIVIHNSSFHQTEPSFNAYSIVNYSNASTDLTDYDNNLSSELYIDSRDYATQESLKEMQFNFGKIRNI